MTGVWGTCILLVMVSCWRLTTVEPVSYIQANPVPVKLHVTGVALNLILQCSVINCHFLMPLSSNLTLITNVSDQMTIRYYWPNYSFFINKPLHKAFQFHKVLVMSHDIGWNMYLTIHFINKTYMQEMKEMQFNIKQPMVIQWWKQTIYFFNKGMSYLPVIKKIFRLQWIKQRSHMIILHHK